MDTTDVLVIGAGLAGLAAAAEAAEAGRRVVVVDQEPEASLGGQAWWSFGGLFLVDTPEQRRLRVRDSRALAWQDWEGTAGFDRPDDLWPRRWAEAYVDWAAGEKRSWLRDQGVRLFPVVGWAERGGGLATGPGNSVPRFHIVWGTGPALVAPFVRRCQAAEAAGRLEFRFRHRVTGLAVTDGRVTGATGDVLVPSEAPRGAPSSRTVAGGFEIAAGAVVVTSGGIGGDVATVRKNWPARLGAPPARSARRRARLDRWRDARRGRGGRRARAPPGPDVALRRGHRQPRARLARPRHPHPARPVVAVAGRDGPPPARPVPARLRHARHARPHRPVGPRALVVRPHREDPREGDRALGLGAEPRPDGQERARRARPRPRRRARARRGLPPPRGRRRLGARAARPGRAHERPHARAAAGPGARRARGPSPATARWTTRSPKTSRSRPCAARAPTSATGSSASPGRTRCSTRPRARSSRSVCAS